MLIHSVKQMLEKHRERPAAAAAEAAAAIYIIKSAMSNEHYFSLQIINR